jgi:hypothetical protein
MPVEGNWERVRTPLSRREKRLLVGIAALVAALVAGIAIYAATDSSSDAPGCVTATWAASLGGTTVHKCGAEAVAFCRSQGPRISAVAEACRREGIATG